MALPKMFQGRRKVTSENAVRPVAQAQAPRPPAAEAIGPPPAALELSSIAEWKTLSERVAALRVRLREAEAKREGFLADRAGAERLGDAVESLLAGKALPGKEKLPRGVVNLGEEYEQLTAELRALRLAVPEGERRLETLRGKLSKQAGAPLKEWHALLVAEAIRHTLALASLWQAEHDALESLEDMSIRSTGLVPNGPCAPRWANPSAVAAWVRGLIEEGVVADARPYRDVVAWETPQRGAR